MPFVYTGNLRALKDHVHFGSGECVDLIKALVPGLIGQSTQTWKKGAYVKDVPNLRPGTAIATFGPNGRFPHANTGQHAAIFVAHAGAGIYVVEQYCNSVRVLYGTWRSHATTHNTPTERGRTEAATPWPSQ